MPSASLRQKSILFNLIRHREHRVKRLKSSLLNILLTLKGLETCITASPLPSETVLATLKSFIKFFIIFIYYYSFMYKYPLPRSFLTFAKAIARVFSNPYLFIVDSQ